MGRKWNAIGRWLKKNWPKLLEGYFKYDKYKEDKKSRRRGR